MNSEEQPKREFITAGQVAKKMGIEPTPERIAWVEAQMDALIQAGSLDPALDADYAASNASRGLISVAQVVSGMGLEPTPELVSEAQQEMVTWWEHEFRDVEPIDDGGVTCYYRRGDKRDDTYQFREDLYRTKIEEIVRRIAAQL